MEGKRVVDFDSASTQGLRKNGALQNSSDARLDFIIIRSAGGDFCRCNLSICTNYKVCFYCSCNGTGRGNQFSLMAGANLGEISFNLLVDNAPVETPLMSFFSVSFAASAECTEKKAKIKSEYGFIICFSISIVFL
jgi:hypothetical protein